MSEQSQNENMEELMRLGISEDWAFTIALVADSTTFATRNSAVVNHGVPKGPVFEPGHEPVSKEGRELLRVIVETPEHELIPRGMGRHHDHPILTPLYAYRDSLTPAVVVPDGWEKRNGCYMHLASGCRVQEEGDEWIYTMRDGIARITSAIAQPLPDTFAAAKSMLERLGLVAPDTTTDADPNPWHKTDGMAPPKEAGDRVIETVDGDGDECTNPAHHGWHCWGSDKHAFRPIKWRYADGGE